MCKSRLEFEYCCFMICAAVFMLLYQAYNAISSDNVVVYMQTEMDIHIMEEMKQTTLIQNKFISDTDNLTILIGLSPHKCGSSYIHNNLKQSFDILGYHYIENDPIELRYWDTCMIPYYNYFETDSSHNLNTKNDDGGCNFNGYLDKFTNGQALDTTNDRYILFEHTPSYIRYYHSCYLLAHYSKIYNVYFYVSFRNPRVRTWYEYWMHYNYKYSINNTVDINKMSTQIHDEIDSFPKSYPKYQKLFDYIAINPDINTTINDNNDIDEDKVVDLWIDATYDLFNNVDFNTFSSRQAINEMIEGKHSAFNVPPFAISCYYPQVLMWYHTFKNHTMNLGDRFKIFQFEWIHEKNGPRTILQQFLLWLNNDNQIPNKSRNYLDLLMKLYQKKLNDKFYEKTIEMTDNKLGDKLDKLYNDCNVRLYRFLKQHSELLLIPDHEFKF